jgi:hypothetical protein
MNLKKFIKEEIGMSDGVNDEFDFIRDVIPGIRKGMFLCNQYGDQWEVLNTDQTNTGKKLLILLSNDDNVRNQPKPYTAAYIIDRIINGTLTICDTIKEGLTESDDFDWAKGDIEYPIEFLIGKKMYWRRNNLGSLEDSGYTMRELNKEDLIFGKIRWNNSWVITKLDGWKDEDAVIEISSGGSSKYLVSEVKDFVRLGIWVVEDDNGRLLNESDDLQWIKDIKPSWLKVGQKFINKYHYKDSLKYNKDGYCQVGSWTFEIYDISGPVRKEGDNPTIRFIHNDTLRLHQLSPNQDKWEQVKNYESKRPGLDFKQAEKNIQNGFWIPLIDCEQRTMYAPNGEPLERKFEYCRPSGKDFIKESDDLDWIKDIEPEITPKSIPMYYNKPFYWYSNGKPVSEWGMPRIYWLEGWKPYSRVDEEQMSLFCYKDLSVSSEIYNSECTEFLNRTIVNYIKRGIIVFQPQLSDIKND